MANVAIAKINVLKKAIASGIKDDDALLNLYTP